MQTETAGRHLRLSFALSLDEYRALKQVVTDRGDTISAFVRKAAMSAATETVGEPPQQRAA